MDTKELAKKPPMAAPGFTVLTPKTETAYDRKIQAEQEKQMADCCCGGYGRQAYDHYGYKPRPQNPTQETAIAESTAASQSVPPPEKKNNKR
jgi:hypothetical protein